MRILVLGGRLSSPEGKSDPINAPEVLSGKVALITGGSGGIGLAMAESLLKSGAKVIIAGRNENKLRSCREKYREEARLSCIVIDVFFKNLCRRRSNSPPRCFLKTGLISL